MEIEAWIIKDFNLPNSYPGAGKKIVRKAKLFLNFIAAATGFRILKPYYR